MSNYEKLHVWQEAHKFVVEVYRTTEGFPDDEKYGLVSQIRRAASSIPINIAEGSGRMHKKEFLQFLNIARGSASEVEYELLLAHDLGYMPVEKYDILKDQVDHILRMLSNLIISIKQ